jgi:hypothetical protein
MVPEPNSFGNPEFLKDLEFIHEQLSATDLGQHQTESQVRSDVTELADLLAAHGAGAASADPAPDLVLNEIIKEFRLNQVLEQACLATGATGVAIALVRGEEMVCCASTGPQAPDIGVCLDPRTGLSGSCVQTRQLQQCSDTETDPRGVWPRLAGGSDGRTSWRIPRRVPHLSELRSRSVAPRGRGVAEPAQRAGATASGAGGPV